MLFFGWGPIAVMIPSFMYFGIGIDPSHYELVDSTFLALQSLSFMIGCGAFSRYNRLKTQVLSIFYLPNQHKIQITSKSSIFLQNVTK